MKILFVIASLGSGGAERVLSNLSNYLCEDHAISIATFSNEDSFYTLDKRVTHIKLDLLKISNSPFQAIQNNLNRFLVLKETIKSVDADINISFMTQTNILTILATKLLKNKVIASERTVYDYYQSRKVNFLRRIAYPFSNYLVVQTISDSQNYGFVKNKKVIYNPLVMKTFKQKKEKIILAVGRLDKQKGFDLLLRTFAQLNTDGWKLIIAGDGIERENLLALADSLKLKNVEFIGKREDIFSWYAKSAIFVLTSKREGFPNVLLEAMASGCAVVSFDCPYGPGEIIEHEKNGLLIENQNKELLSISLQRLIDNEALRDTLASEAVMVNERFALINIAKEWEETILKVVDND